jgi:hypothetical protein
LPEKQKNAEDTEQEKKFVEEKSKKKQRRARAPM